MRRRLCLNNYDDVVSLHHEDFELHNCGYVINPTFPHLGASQDGIFTSDCHGVSIRVEVAPKRSWYCPDCRIKFKGKRPYKYFNSYILVLVKRYTTVIQAHK